MWQAVVKEVRERHSRKYSFIGDFEKIVEGHTIEFLESFEERVRKRWAKQTLQYRGIHLGKQLSIFLNISFFCMPRFIFILVRFSHDDIHNHIHYRENLWAIKERLLERVESQRNLGKELGMIQTSPINYGTDNFPLSEILASLLGPPQRAATGSAAAEVLRQ